MPDLQALSAEGRHPLFCVCSTDRAVVAQILPDKGPGGVSVVIPCPHCTDSRPLLNALENSK